MSSQKYLNFDLAIERTGDHYRARVLQSCVGEGSVEFALPFSEYELKYLILQMGHSPSGDERHAHLSDSPELAAAKEFGTKLFGAVFQRDVYACLYASLNEARSSEQGLRVLLRLPPELTSLQPRLEPVLLALARHPPGALPGTGTAAPSAGGPASAALAGGDCQPQRFRPA